MSWASSNATTMTVPTLAGVAILIRGYPGMGTTPSYSTNVAKPARGWAPWYLIMTHTLNELHIDSRSGQVFSQRNRTMMVRLAYHTGRSFVKVANEVIVGKDNILKGSWPAHMYVYCKRGISKP